MQTSQSSTHLPVVSTKEGRGRALKARMTRMGLTIGDLAREISERTRLTISREQLGQVLADKVPGSRAFEAIERTLIELEVENGHQVPSTATEGMVTIVAEGVYGIRRLKVIGSAGTAEATMARLIADISSGNLNIDEVSSDTSIEMTPDPEQPSGDPARGRPDYVWPESTPTPPAYIPQTTGRTFPQVETKAARQEDEEA